MVFSVGRDQSLHWSSARARRASWDWKSGPAKLHYLWGLSAFGEPHILRFLERFWRYMPQFATVSLVGGFRDDGASGAREEPAGFGRNLRACRLLRYSGPVRRKQRNLPHHSPRYLLRGGPQPLSADQAPPADPRRLVHAGGHRAYFFLGPKRPSSSLFAGDWLVAGALVAAGARLPRKLLTSFKSPPALPPGWFVPVLEGALVLPAKRPLRLWSAPPAWPLLPPTPCKP